MRHLGTLIAAAAIAPIAWVLLAFGQDRSGQAFANAQGDGTLESGDFLRPALCLAAAGILFGLIGTLRFSPLGAVVTGIGYAGSYLALLVDPQAVVDLFPAAFTMAGKQADPTTPLRTGSALLLGAMLLIAVVSVGRWRRWPGAREPEPGETDEVEPHGPASGLLPVDTTWPDPALPAWRAEPDPAADRAIDHEPAAGVSGWVSSLRGHPDRSFRIPTSPTGWRARRVPRQRQYGG
ncbi:MAG TPA: hypothetical protein VFR67_13955 [Pilimelia sp.]|nr:hypothetical protein [Pilimelia sp.]